MAINPTLDILGQKTCWVDAVWARCLLQDDWLSGELPPGLCGSDLSCSVPRGGEHPTFPCDWGWFSVTVGQPPRLHLQWERAKWTTWWGLHRDLNHCLCDGRGDLGVEGWLQNTSWTAWFWDRPWLREGSSWLWEPCLTLSAASRVAVPEDFFSHGSISVPEWVSVPHTHLGELPEKDHRAQMGSHPYPHLGGLPERAQRAQMREHPYPNLEDFLRGLHSSGNISSVARWVYLKSICSWTLKLSWSFLTLMSIESEMPSNHLILCHPLLLPPSVFPSIRVCSNELVLRIRWPKYWRFRLSISPSNEYSGLIFFRID